MNRRGIFSSWFTTLKFFFFKNLFGKNLNSPNKYSQIGGIIFNYNNKNFVKLISRKKYEFIFRVIIFTKFFSKHTTCWFSSLANTSHSWHVANDVGVWPDYRYYYHVASDTKKIKDLIMLRISPIFLLIIIIAKTKILHKRSSKIYS